MNANEFKLSDIAQSGGVTWTAAEHAESVLADVLATLYDAERYMQRDQTALAQIAVGTACSRICERLAGNLSAETVSEISSLTGIRQVVLVCELIAAANGVEMDACATQARAISDAQARA